jgi:tRNA pseudouridine38-40 synthase
MQLACQSLIGKKDFSAFARSGSDNIHFECDVLYAGWVQQQDVLVFEIRANRFLRNMVRAIVGTMIDIGRKKMSLPEFDEIIAGRNRSAAGVSAQARGLFLWDIAYPPDIFIAD